MPEISREWMWRVILSGGVVFHGQRRLFKWIPGTRRCKNCPRSLGRARSCAHAVAGEGIVSSQSTFL